MMVSHKKQTKTRPLSPAILQEPERLTISLTQSMSFWRSSSHLSAALSYQVYTTAVPCLCTERVRCLGPSTYPGRFGPHPSPSCVETSVCSSYHSPSHEAGPCSVVAQESAQLSAQEASDCYCCLRISSAHEIHRQRGRQTEASAFFSQTMMLPDSSCCQIARGAGERPFCAASGAAAAAATTAAAAAAPAW